jgi:alkylation response protein AidB-like acyl-CoA dehydrogenase
MDFDLTDEQRLLKDSVDRLMADKYQFAQRRAYMADPTGFSADLWSAYAEMGLLGLPFEETLGGFGGGPVETMIVMEAFGRGLVLEPYFATVTLGGGLLRHAGSDALRGALVPPLTAGKLKLAFAHVERQSRYDLNDVVTTARKDGGAFLLDGAKSVVLHGDAADKILVTARVSGGRRDRDGIGLFLVDASSPGLMRRGYPTQDGQRAAEVTLAGVRVGADGMLSDDALPAIERVVDEAIAALCAEAVGTMQAMQDLTLEYLKTRKQFGRTIGSFQVLQHRSVDMLVELRAIAAAKVQIGRSGRHIGQEAIQLHGGIGMTMEYAVGHHFKRMTVINQMFGDADAHLATLARLGGLFGKAA